MQQELRKDYGEVNVNELCRRDSRSKEIQVICFQQAGTLHEFVADFDVLSNKYRSDLFISAWKNAVSSAVCTRSRIQIDDVYSMIWQPCLQQCTELLTSIANLSIKFADLDVFLKHHHFQLSLHTQLLSLFNGVAICSKGEPTDWKKIETAMERMKQYWRVCHYCNAAEVILQVRDSLGLTMGDFSLIEKVSYYILILLAHSVLHYLPDSLLTLEEI